MKKICFFITMAFASLTVMGQLYQTDFGTTTSGTPPNPFQPTPVSINSNLSYGTGGGWTGGTIFFTGSGGSGDAAYAINTSNGNGTFTLTLTVANGFKLNATGISCQMRRTNTGPSTVAMTVNGVSFTVTGAPGSGSFAAVSSSGPAADIIGTFTVTITTSGGSGSSQNVRLDDFSLMGTISPEGATLPVKFANVKASEQGSGTLINWSNLTETDVKDYTVEHSANGNNFIAIGSVNPRSNNDGREDYSFLHNNVTSTISYYRIRSTEFNNESKYSIVVRVDRRKGQTIVNVYPNPSSGSDIVMQATDLVKGRYTMTVYAANGQQVAAQILNHNGGSVTEPVLLPPALKAGVYTLLLQSADTKITSRFVVR